MHFMGRGCHFQDRGDSGTSVAVLEVQILSLVVVKMIIVRLVSWSPGGAQGFWLLEPRVSVYQFTSITHHISGFSGYGDIIGFILGQCSFGSLVGNF